MILLVSLVVIAAIIFLSGPRIRIDQTIFPKNLPLNLDDYLVLQEKRFSDIRELAVFEFPILCYACSSTRKDKRS